MKNGLFSSLLLSTCLLVVTSGLHGCASFLELSEYGSDSEEYDRGYVAAGSEEDDDAESVSPVVRRSPASNYRDNEPTNEQRRIQRAIEMRDVVLGMSPRDVVESWGQPAQREVAGRNGQGGHERWTYGSRYSLNSPRTVIFEKGRVSGWNR